MFVPPNHHPTQISQFLVQDGGICPTVGSDLLAEESV